jgi:hypothetical protein
VTDISEDLVVAEAQVVASHLITWFRQRLLTAEAERDVAVQDRVSAEDDRRAADRQRDVAVAARESAEDDRRAADEQRDAAQRRVIEVEALLAASEELAEQLQRALDVRIVIEQAKGFLVARHGVTPDEAFEAMRSHARRTRVTVHAVAVEALTGAPQPLDL